MCEIIDCGNEGDSSPDRYAHCRLQEVCRGHMMVSYKPSGKHGHSFRLFWSKYQHAGLKWIHLWLVCDLYHKRIIKVPSHFLISVFKFRNQGNTRWWLAKECWTSIWRTIATTTERVVGQRLACVHHLRLTLRFDYQLCFCSLTTWHRYVRPSERVRAV